MKSSQFPLSLGNGFVLVLSGGAARGMAHLGFLKAFEETELPVRAIVGTSAGAIAGSLFASPECTIERVQKRILNLKTREMFRFGWSRMGIFDSGNTMKLLHDLIGPETAFKDLRYPLVATATSLTTKTLALLESGNVGTAVTASSALPPFFTPVLRNGESFVDGGILSILPVMAARSRYPGIPTVSVNVNEFHDFQCIPDPYPGALALPSGDGPISGNWLTLTLRLYSLGLYRMLQIESSFSDWYIGISGGRFSMSSTSCLDKLFQLGYDAGRVFVRYFNA